MKKRIGRFIDLSEQKFGRLTCLELADPPRYKGKTYWTCRCECGMIKDIAAPRLIEGCTTSCGCFRKELYEKLNPLICHKLDLRQVNQIRLCLEQGESIARVAKTFNVAYNTVVAIRDRKTYRHCK